MGVELQHEGNSVLAHARYEAAVQADAGCAAAHLRLSLTGLDYATRSQNREIYTRAVALGSALGERDRALLDALTFLVRSEPEDRPAFVARLRRILARFPGDAELLFLTAVYTPDPESMLASARAAVALDPHYSDAWQIVARALRKLRRFDEAAEALDACLREAPGSSDCLFEGIDVARLRRRCGEVTEKARLWIRREPQRAGAYQALALGLAAGESSPDAIEEALRQAWARLPEADRARVRPMDEARIDLLLGRFDLALERAEAASHAADGEADAALHEEPAQLLVEIAEETGKPAAAAAIARSFLGRKDVWNQSGFVTAYLEPLMLDVERDTGVLPEPEWRAARSGWMERARSTGLEAERIWAFGVAMPSRTREEANLAVQSMPTFADPPNYPIIFSFRATAVAARTLLRAELFDDAATLLRRLTMSCEAFTFPVTMTQASLWLGQALERSGDVKGACAAYRTVERRWGSATPPSVSAAAARAAIQALRTCP
jgi:tetratricopeptide (TPR) repeat protein